MAKNQTPAKTPGVGIARVLRGLGLKQGLDFSVRAERKNGERIGTRVAVFGREADQTVADNADLIERLAAAEGFHFNVSAHYTPSGVAIWVHVANYGAKTRQTHFLSATPAEPTEAAEDQPLRDRAVALAAAPVTEGRARTLDEYVAERKHGVRCAHETSRGYGCLNQAKGGPFCPGHNPRNQCGQLTVAGTSCKRRAGSDGGPCTKHRPTF